MVLFIKLKLLVLVQILQSEGKIKIARRKITIFDIEKLREEVNPPVPQVASLPVPPTYSETTARLI